MPAKRLRLIAILVLVLAAGGITLVGSVRHLAGDASGGPIAITSSMPATAPTRLRLATFNIHSGVGRDGDLDLKRTADLLRGYDLICLNEVNAAGPWWEDQTEALASYLDRKALFVPTERRFWHESFGSAVLTDRTISRWRRTQLPSTSGSAFRNMLWLEIPFAAGQLNVLMAHVGRDSDHQPQFQVVADAFLRLPAPAVLMGDLNTVPDDPILGKLLANPGVEDPVGRKTGKTTNQRIDYILLRGVGWTDAGLVENNASDHPLAWVQIEAK